MFPTHTFLEYTRFDWFCRSSDSPQHIGLPNTRSVATDSMCNTRAHSSGTVQDSHLIPFSSVARKRGIRNKTDDKISANRMKYQIYLNISEVSLIKAVKQIKNSANKLSASLFFHFTQYPSPKREPRRKSATPIRFFPAS